MPWRFPVILVTLFWMVMAALLVRVTYFPEGSQFAQVPPSEVFKIFLDRSGTLSTNTLHLYHGEKKLGHAILTPRRSESGTGNWDYLLVLSGIIDRGALDTVNSTVAWRLNLHLRGGEHWGGASGQIRLPEESKIFEFDWPAESPVPRFSLRDHGNLVVDDGALRLMLGSWNVDSLEGKGAPVGGRHLPGDQAELIKVKAREGHKNIAGQSRKGYFIEFLITDHYRARAFFTETGELAVVELPEGYRALEPVIHGLVPDDPEDEPL
jgi:hypothetical protein